MACVRKRRGRWVVDYRDSFGRRRWITKATKREAEDALAEVLPASRIRRTAEVSPDITMAEYAERWLQLCGSLAPQTRDVYRSRLENHVLPTRGATMVRTLSRPMVRSLMVELLEKGLAPKTVRAVLGAVRAMLSSAVEDEIVTTNAAAGLARGLKLPQSRADDAGKVKALDPDQLRRLLVGAEERVPHLVPLFTLVSRTGLRLGEALALRWGDVDLERGEMHVSRSLTPRGRERTTKTRRSQRTVDLSRQAVETLRGLRAAAREAGLRSGSDGLGAWIFPSSRLEGRPMLHSGVEHGFARAVRAAGLPEHFTPHCLRHTYASILLSEGVSPAYVQEQLGHASIEMTVSVYGRWIRKKAPGAVDILDRLGSEVVAEPPGAVADGSGGGEQSGAKSMKEATYGRPVPVAGADERKAGGTEAPPPQPSPDREEPPDSGGGQ